MTPPSTSSTPTSCSSTWGIRWPPSPRCAGCAGRGDWSAARDADYPTFRFFPDQPDIARAIEAYGTLTRVNGANWDAGRRLLHWARSAGFAAIAPSASVWCFATPDERNWWGELWAERFTHSWLAEQLVGHGVVPNRTWRCSPGPGGRGRHRPTGGSR